MVNEIYKKFYDLALGQYDVDAFIKDVLSTKDLFLVDRLSFQAFCCALLADKTKDILQIKQYFKEVCEYLNQSLSIDNEGYTPHLVRLMIESHMHDAQFIDHRPEDSHFIKSYAGADVNPYLVRLGKELIENLPQSTK